MRTNRPRPTCAIIATVLSFLWAGISLAQITYPDNRPSATLRCENRERLLFNDGWRFQKGDPAGVGDSLTYDLLKPWLLAGIRDVVAVAPKRPDGEAPGEKLDVVQPSFDDSAWRSLTLPHDWGVEGPFQQTLSGETGKLPWSGVGWYRKRFTVEKEKSIHHYQLEIDGAMSYAAVWCNGRFVGGWPYGYTSWRLDLTPYLKPGGDNLLAIRLDNPDDSSRWYPGGGIYRNVWLEKTSPVYVDRWGTVVTTPELSAAAADIEIKTKIDNRLPRPVDVRVVTQIFKLSAAGTPEGNALAESTIGPVTIPAGGTAPAKARLRLKKPKLWDIVHPERYVAVTTLQERGNLMDRQETTFGIRSAVFTVNDGFHLNGKRVPLQGVCLHHDLGSLGAAFNTRAAERQLEMLKEMGCNAIRTSHNPAAPEFLELCDRMGFLVIAEFSDTWTIAKKSNGYARLFNDWAEADLRSMIRRDRNHPSVILWSTGNEIGEQTDADNSLHPVSARLTAITHEEDPTRAVTVGCDRPEAGQNGFQKTIDVFGYNYKPHLYKSFRDANPGQALYGSETASAYSSRGEYLFPPDASQNDGTMGYHLSSYDLYASGNGYHPDTEFKGQDENPFVAGEFVWTGFDYLGEPTPFWGEDAPSRSSYYGIIDLAGFKKDRFYLYQARWRPELPMAHILPHWNWPERMGEVTPVHVYTSGDEAELFLNGQSLGRRKKGKLEYRLCWNEVKYAPGELKVIAYKNGREWATDRIKTAGDAARLLLAPDRATIAADGRDLSFLAVTVVDKDGQKVPRAKPKLKFEIAGPGELVSTDNGDPTDHTAFQSAARAAFNGHALAIVRARPGRSGPIIVRVTSEGLASAEVTVNAEPSK